MTEPLRAIPAFVRDDIDDSETTHNQQYQTPTTTKIPQFEGKEVEYTGAKITSVGSLEIGDEVWRVDEFVRMVVECRVVAVDHKVNEKTGYLGRIHLLKAIDSKVIPWDEQP